MYVISELLEWYFTEKRLRKSSCQSYGVACRALIRQLGDCLVEEIDRAAILKWRKAVVDVTVKPVSWNTYMRHLRVLYQYGLAAGRIGPIGNPFDNTQIRCPRRPDKTVKKETLKQARCLLDTMRKEEDEWEQRSEFYPAWFWRTVLETLIYTGMRANELICLRMCDVDLREQLICIRAEVSKNYQERKIPIHDKLRPYLLYLIDRARRVNVERQDQLFNVNVFSARHRQKNLNMDQVSSFFKRLSEKLPERISPHRLRHTTATELMRNHKRDIHTVREFLGHQNIATTMRYISVDHVQMRDLINTTL